MRIRRGGLVALMAVAALMLDAGAAGAQTGEPPRIFAVEATPVGALPPLGLPMPASRNHNYLTFRAQSGYRYERQGPDLLAVAGGVDLQWRGGSIFGVTAGYQMPECEEASPCGNRHTFFGARARFNVFTGGPTIGGMFGDYSANTTLGAEVGFGYAPDAAPGFDACAVDVGVPLAVAMLQTVRLVGFVTPTAAISVDCGSGFEKHSDVILNAGIGIQQIFLRGLDVHVGLQRMFREDTGYQFGASVTYVHLP